MGAPASCCEGLALLEGCGLERQVLMYLVSADLAEHSFFLVRAHRIQAADLMRVCQRWRKLLRPLSRSWRARRFVAPPAKRALVAATADQKRSLAERSERVRWARYETVTLGRRDAYFEVSCCPITVRAEDDMELLSDLSTWGERFLDHWAEGSYTCARCESRLYSSRDKWSGPCVWPSWRKHLPGAVRELPVVDYNGYACAVRELYCASCDLFLGHMFADAAEKGDAHPEARWRH